MDSRWARVGRGTIAGEITEAVTSVAWTAQPGSEITNGQMQLTSEVTAGGSQPDVLARALGIAGLAVGIVGVVFGLASRHRERNS